MLKGSLVALITPFKNGQLDKESLKNLIDFHVENGTDGIVVAGTTGESATLTYTERLELMLHYRLFLITINLRRKVFTSILKQSQKRLIFL